MSNNEPLDIEQDVKNFHEKFHQYIAQAAGLVDKSTLEFRKERIREECKELLAAIDEGDLVHIANEAVDLVYVTVGLFVICGIPFHACWRAVQRANMAKVYRPPVDGVIQKPLKPTGWRSPAKWIWDVLNGNRYGAVHHTFGKASAEFPDRPVKNRMAEGAD